MRNIAIPTTNSSVSFPQLQIDVDKKHRSVLTEVLVVVRKDSTLIHLHVSKSDARASKDQPLLLTVDRASWMKKRFELPVQT